MDGLEMDGRIDELMDGFLNIEYRNIARSDIDTTRHILHLV
jgi:hypothetical protein